MHATRFTFGTLAFSLLVATGAEAAPGDEFTSVTLETPPEAYDADQGKSTLGAATIFTNFDGEVLNCVNNYQDDSRTNTSWVCGSYAGVGPFNYAAYNGGGISVGGGFYYSYYFGRGASLETNEG